MEIRSHLHFSDYPSARAELVQFGLAADRIRICAEGHGGPLAPLRRELSTFRPQELDWIGSL